MTQTQLADLGYFGVSHYLCPPDCKLTDFLDAAANAGFRAIGLTERALQEMALHAIRAELRARDLAVCSVNTAGYFLHEEQRLIEQHKTNMFLLQAASELEAVNGVNLIVGGSSAMPMDQAREHAFEQSALLAQTARSLGTRLLLEPMHPLQATGKGCVNTLAQAHRWVAQIPGLALNVDIFHSWWDPGFSELISGNRGSVGVVQICDVAINPDTMLPSRVPFDEGQVFWRDVVRTLVQEAPDIPLEVELFAVQMPGRDALEVLTHSAIALEKLLQESST